MGNSEVSRHISVQPKKKRGFLIFILLYIIFVLSAGFFALRYLYNYLEEYETTLPKHVLQAYKEKLQNGDISEESISTLSRIDTEIQSREDSLRFIREKLSHAQLFKAINECTDDADVYTIQCEGNIVGRAVMTTVGKTVHGFPIWEFTGSEFNFDGYLSKASITVPPEFRVEANGVPLSQNHIAEKNIHFDLLSSFYSAYPSLPTLVRYETGSILGEIHFSVYNSGNSVLREDELNEVLYLKSLYPPSNDTELKAFTHEFITRYADYTSNAGGYTTMLYSQLKELVIPESNLHNRIRLAFDAMNYIVCSRCTVSDEKTIASCEPIPGLWFTQIEYTTTVKGEHEEKSSDTTIGIITVRDSNGALRAESMATY